MKKKCKICNTKFLDNLNLGNHPCADTFLKNKKKAISLKRYPLIVGYCNCSHLTSINKVPEKERYEKYEYSYTSDNSPVSRKHFKNIALKIIKSFKISKKSFVVEAGSNDGTFLNEIKNSSKSKVLGVDPSKNISKLAKRKKIETLINYFNYKNSKNIVRKYGKADVFYGANVFNHVDDNIDFLKGVNFLLRDKGVVILEVPDLNSLIERVGFDTIYHEHRHYYSEKSLEKILNKENFYIFKIEKISYMSGSIRVFARKKYYKNKKKLTHVSLKDFKIFKKKINLVSNKILSFISKFKFKNIKVYGIGAATKGNTLLNYCNLNYDHIESILDKSKHKINKYTPGSGIEIVDENKVKDINAMIILPWNITKHLKSKIMKKRKIPYISIQKAIKEINEK
tara:strand:+ start:168 stop:1358 length:1191 start_codon:yes stop_codon:yes gene_type:complete